MLKCEIYRCNKCGNHPCVLTVYQSRTLPTLCPLGSASFDWKRLVIEESVPQPTTTPAKNFCSECGSKLK